MKKIIVFICLFVSTTAPAQINVIKDNLDRPAITEKGKPDGEKTVMKIGKEGGSFTSLMIK